MLLTKSRTYLPELVVDVPLLTNAMSSTTTTAAFCNTFQHSCSEEKCPWRDAHAKDLIKIVINIVVCARRTTEKTINELHSRHRWFVFCSTEMMMTLTKPWHWYRKCSEDSTTKNLRDAALLVPFARVDFFFTLWLVMIWICTTVCHAWDQRVHAHFFLCIARLISVVSYVFWNLQAYQLSTFTFYEPLLFVILRPLESHTYLIGNSVYLILRFIRLSIFKLYSILRIKSFSRTQLCFPLFM